MLVIGIGYLFPISAIWAAFDYWKVLFPKSNIEFVVTGVYQVGSMVTVALLVLFGTSGHLGKRIQGGFGGQFVCLAAILAFRWAPVEESDELYYPLLLSVLLCSVATGYLDSALFAVCSQYQNDMQRMLQIGIGLGTMVSVFYRDLTKLIMSRDVADATSLYFVVALATVIFCIACYRLLMRLEVSRHVKLSIGAEADAAAAFATPPRSPVLSQYTSGTPLSPLMGTPLLPEEDKRSSVAAKGGDARTAAGRRGEDKFSVVLRLVWRQQMVIFLNLTLTTLSYPGMITSIPCREFSFLEKDAWFQTLLLTAFTSADIVGRIMTKYTFGLTYNNIYWTVVFRFFLSPLILFCIWSSALGDAVSFSVVMAFGFLNGYCVSLALIVPNEMKHLSDDQRKVCSFMSACSVNSGLCAGSLLAAAAAAGLGLSGS